MSWTKQAIHDVALFTEHLSVDDFRKALVGKSEKACALLLQAYGFWHQDVFARVYMRNAAKQKFGPHHHDIMNAVKPRSRGVRHVVAAPRGSGKTTVHTIGIVHHIVYKEWYEALGIQPNDFIIVIGEKHGAHRILSNVRGVLETNRSLHKYFGDFIGSTWGWEQTRTSNGVFLLPASRESKIRGENDEFRRPLLVVLSDVQKGRDIDSPLIRDKDITWFRDDVSHLEGTDATDETAGIMNLVVEGTTLHQESIVSMCLNNPAYTGNRYPAITKWAKRVDLWDKWKSKYIEHANPKAHENAAGYFRANRDDMLDETEILWKQGLSYYRCQVMLISEGLGSFNREMQQNPINPEKQMFDLDHAMYFRVDPQGMLREDGRLVLWDNIVGASCFLDWAGGRDKKANCYAAITVILWERFGHTDDMVGYVIDAWADKVSPTEQVKRCFVFFARYQRFPFRLAFEAAHMSEVVDNELKKAFIVEKERRQSNVPQLPWNITPSIVHQRIDKDNRIGDMEPKISSHLLVFNQHLPVEFTEQLEQFPTHDFNDCPDSLEGASQLKPYPKNEEPETLDHWAYEAEQDEEHMIAL